MSSKATSTLQDRQPQQQFQPDAQPPNTKIIECSLSNSDNSRSDNSEWTNILKEPILMKKGSEIRIQQSAIDMTGIDSDIIQFQSTGTDQDNSHTFLCQHYTTNDGTNGKTTTYDYMGANDNETTGMFYHDPGQGYTGLLSTNYIPTLTTLTGVGTNFQSIFAQIKPHAIRPKNILITSGGKDYDNGARFTIATATTPFEGFIQTDDLGSITNLIFTTPTSDNPPTNPNQLDFVKPTRGVNAVIVNTFTTNGLVFDSFHDTLFDASRGENYQFGDRVSLDTDQNALTVPSEDRAIFGIKSIYMGTGQPSIDTFMDAGYNYQRVPVYRWSHSFDLNTNFSYGKNLGARTFLSEGNTIGIKTTSAHQQNDACLSAGKIIMNKEDEFAPGIFHDLKDNRDFTLNAPVLYFTKTGGTQFTLQPSFPTGWQITIANTNADFNDQSVKNNPLNAMPIGSIFQSYMDFNNLPTPTDQQLIDLSTFSNKWNTQLKITSREVNRTLNTTTVRFNEVENYIGAVSRIKLGNPLSGFPNPDGVYSMPLTFVSAEDGLSPPTTAPTLSITIVGGNLYTLNVEDGGIGNRIGMLYSLTDHPTLTKFYSQGIDEQGGFTFPANRGEVLLNSDLEITSGGIDYDVDWFLIPTNQHDISQVGNRLVYRKELDPPTIESNFPVSLLESKLDTTRTITANVSNQVSNGLFRGNGELNSNDPEFDNYRGAFTNHDSSSSYDVATASGSLVNITVDYGNTATDVVIPYTGTNYWLYDTLFTTQPKLRLNKANFDALNIPLPLNRTITFKSNPHETQIQTLGLESVDATYYYITVLAQASHQQRETTIQPAGASLTYLGLSQTYFTGAIETNDEDLNGKGITAIQMIYPDDPKTYNTQIQLTWTPQIKGSLAVSSQHNFFGSNDIQYNQIIQNREPIAMNASDLTIKSYNEGGYYYMSKFFGNMTTKDGTSYKYNLEDYNGYNLGYDNFLLAELPPDMYAWRDGYQSPSDLNYNQSFTNIASNWNYYPLYRQKTITISKNFCVATDISGIWNNSAHELKGAINPTDGTEYTSKENSGILQNEFIMPVYGANNMINSAGKYIEDFTMYSDSDGLEPGHCKGISYVEPDNNWLSGNIMYNLPKDENGITYYDVFFRTPFTKIRNYDPLATTQHPLYPLSVRANRTPLDTVSLDAYKIGNANAIASTTKKSLDGSTMLQTTNTDPPASPPLADNKAYELGEASGVNVGGNPIKFGNESYYPIYYLDDDKRGEYKKAKISNFIGSSEVALVFDSSISAFTFQFLHQPFTSAFVDGNGGSQSVRVFFGNRREGILNHDSVGGLMVVNYARPDYPRNTFSRIEVEDNTATGDYFPYGIDPLKSTSLVGRTFMNKLGFKDNDIGLLPNGKIDPDNTQLSYSYTTETRNLDGLEDASPYPSDFTIKVAKTIFHGTTGTDIDTTDSIISQIPSAESSAGLESHNQLETPFLGRSRTILRKWGDYIFYPYGINSDTNSFSSTTSIVRFDNCTSSFGTIGGQLLSNSARSMGIPNVLGSLSNVDDSTIPVQLNPDCLIYTSYTIACGSSLKQASSLPIKLNQGYLLVLSSLMKQPNVYLSKVGFVNAMSIVNTTFLTGDYILSQGELQFYAQEDTYISEITTSIKNSNFSNPSTLGKNSTVIYSITDYQPTSDKEPLTIPQEQEEDIQIAQMIEEHMIHKDGGKMSGLASLDKDFYSLGLDILTRKSGNIISAVRNQINFHDLPNLSKKDRNDFLQTPTGQILVQNATDIQMIRSHADDIARANYNEDPRIADSIVRTAESEIRQRHNDILDRTPEFYYQTPERISSEEGTPARREAGARGREIIRTAGYTPEDIERMEQFGRRMAFGEMVDRRRSRGVDPVHPYRLSPEETRPESESGLGTSIADSQ